METRESAVGGKWSRDFSSVTWRQVRWAYVAALPCKLLDSKSRRRAASLVSRDFPWSAHLATATLSACACHYCLEPTRDVLYINTKYRGMAATVLYD